jgi:hypothetical protein
MRISAYITNAFIIALLFSGCIKEFEPSRLGFENLLVVEAFLSDGDEPFEVRLSRSIPIDTSAFIPESGASIDLVSEAGETNPLFESSVGIYRTFAPVNPVVGNQYKLNIRTRGGNIYESEYVVMRPTPDIEKISTQFKEESAGNKRGVQFMVSTSDPGNNTRYYRYEYDETWTFRTPYDSYLVWENNSIQTRGENINTCWKSNKSTSVITTTSTALTNDVISDFPIIFVSTETDRLKVRYSLNVKQYSLSEASYNFWKELEKVTENLGTLFDPQPSTVEGNIFNVNNPDELVLGYFDAAAVKEMRIFVNSSDFPASSYPNYYSFCTDSIVSGGQIPEMMLIGYILVSETVTETGFPGYLMSFPYCIDCRLTGTNVKPDFWQ